jgi:hypothetical protein
MLGSRLLGFWLAPAALAVVACGKVAPESVPLGPATPAGAMPERIASGVSESIDRLAATDADVYFVAMATSNMKRTLYRMSVDGGAVVQVKAMGEQVNDFAITPDGVVYGGSLVSPPTWFVRRVARADGATKTLASGPLPQRLRLPGASDIGHVG